MLLGFLEDYHINKSILAPIPFQMVENSSPLKSGDDLIVVLERRLILMRFLMLN